MTPKRAEPRQVDTRGLKCPWPVLRAARAMREHQAIILLTDDPVALVDVPALARAHGWSVKLDEADDHASFFIRKNDESSGR